MIVVRTFRKGKRGRRGGPDESTVAVLSIMEVTDSATITLRVSNAAAGISNETIESYLLDAARQKHRETLAALRAEGFRLETTKRRD